MNEPINEPKPKRSLLLVSYVALKKLKSLSKTDLAVLEAAIVSCGRAGRSFADQAELAAAVGVTRQAVNRSLQRLADLELLAVGGQRLLVLNPDHLVPGRRSLHQQHMEAYTQAQERRARIRSDQDMAKLDAQVGQWNDESEPDDDSTATYDSLTGSSPMAWAGKCADLEHEESK